MEIHDYGVSVASYKTPNDGSADSSTGIQAALDSGSPLVYLPYGIYRIDRGLKIASNTRLIAHPNAQIFYGDGAGRRSSDFLISNKDPDRGNRNITIAGGIWDGNNRNNPRGTEGDLDAYTGSLINMKNVKGLTLENLLLKDSTAYFIRLSSVTQFRVEKIRHQITHVTRNQDGVHCAGNCSDGHIHDIEARGLYTTGDDLIALNADDALLRSELLGAEAGPIRNLTISNIRADDCHSMIRMASIWSEISNIDIRGVFGGCRNYVLNADGLRYARVPLFDAKQPEYSKGVGLLKNIRLADAEVYHSRKTDSTLFCLESRMDNFVLSNITRDPARDACPDSSFLKMDNVIQSHFIAEYRTKSEAESALGKGASITGSNGCVRIDKATHTFSSAEIHTHYLARLEIGNPEMVPLPEKNCMRGVVE